jgi:septum formation protein
MKVILASTSPYRKQLLNQLNLSFSAVAPLADEEQLKKKAPVSVPDLPLFLAQKKAESLAAQYPEDLIIGCDQMGFLHGQPLNKPGTKDKAFLQLKKLQGQTHQLLTALAVLHKGVWDLHTDVTELSMRSLSDEQIRRYVDLENPIDCAGSYKIEGLGVSLFEKVSTQDPSAIIGLPLMALTRILNKYSISVI